VGAISYRQDGENAVVSGTEFYDALESVSPGSLTGMEGNLALLVGFQFVGNDPSGEHAEPSSAEYFPYLLSNPDQLLNLWLEIDTFAFDPLPYSHSLTFGDDEVLQSTYNELASGWTEIGPDTFLGIHINNDNLTGYFGFITTADEGADPGYVLDAEINTYDMARFRYQPVPEPATVSLVGLGLVGLVATRMRKRQNG
jgi:hypothetical protein